MPVVFTCVCDFVSVYILTSRCIFPFLYFAENWDSQRIQGNIWTLPRKAPPEWPQLECLESHLLEVSFRVTSLGMTHFTNFQSVLRSVKRYPRLFFFCWVWVAGAYTCVCVCVRARARVCVCVCVCLFRSVVGTCNTVATRLQPEHHSRCRYILDQWLRIKSQRTIRSVPLSSSYTKQVLFSEPPSCAWLGETQEPALETTVSSSHQPNGDHGDAAHHSQVFGRTPVTMTTRPLPFSLYVVIGKARACPDQSRWPSSGSTQITTSWTTTALASVELVSKSDLSPNSKHWFKTSFLQSLPYLVTS